MSDTSPPGMGRAEARTWMPDEGGLWTHGLPFTVALQAWGYDVAGNASERSALYAERADDMEWDRPAAYLDGIERWFGDKRLAVPEWWCLPFVVDAVCFDGLVSA